MPTVSMGFTRGGTGTQKEAHFFKQYIRYVKYLLLEAFSEVIGWMGPQVSYLSMGSDNPGYTTANFGAKMPVDPMLKP